MKTLHQKRAPGQTAAEQNCLIISDCIDLTFAVQEELIRLSGNLAAALDTLDAAGVQYGIERPNFEKTITMLLDLVELRDELDAQAEYISRAGAFPRVNLT